MKFHGESFHVKGCTTANGPFWHVTSESSSHSQSRTNIVNRTQPQAEAIFRSSHSARPHLQHLNRLHEAEPRWPKIAMGLEKSGKTHINDLKTSSIICVLEDHYRIKDNLSIWNIQFSPDNRFLATASSVHKIRVHPLRHPRLIKNGRYGTSRKIASDNNSKGS